MTPEELEEMAGGFQAATIVLAANHAGIFGALCAAPMGSEELARRLKLNRRAVATVTDALVCLGALEREGDRLRVPPGLVPALDRSSPATRANALDHRWYVLQRWARLDSVLETGEPIPRLREDEERLRAFILGMADMARRGAAALWSAVDLSGRAHLVDVGGGPGELALAALERFPGLVATVFDLPAVMPIAREYAAGRGLRERIRFMAGDALRDDIPACDAALVSSLLHSYGLGRRQKDRQARRGWPEAGRPRHDPRVHVGRRGPHGPADRGAVRGEHALAARPRGAAGRRLSCRRYSATPASGSGGSPASTPEPRSSSARGELSPDAQGGPSRSRRARG